MYRQSKLSLLFPEAGVAETLESLQLLFLCLVSYFECQRFFPESKILRRNEAGEEYIDTISTRQGVDCHH